VTDSINMNPDFNFDSGLFCRKVILSKSRFANISDRRCHKLINHDGRCEELPFVNHLLITHSRVAKKIVRDAIMTTGAAWKSEQAGPNRIIRWSLLLNDDELLRYGIKMSTLKPHVIAKLREKAADYDSCIRVASWLTYLVYQMPDAPKPPDHIGKYLEKLYGVMIFGSTICIVCRVPLSFNLFEKAQRGRAAIETCHKNPRVHSPVNVGLGHRECNIAQGGKTLDDFYDWIAGILRRARPELFFQSSGAGASKAFS
jgi:hypothetical protein